MASEYRSLTLSTCPVGQAARERSELSLVGKYMDRSSTGGPGMTDTWSDEGEAPARFISAL